jgi:hypothetical protein
MDCYDYLFKIKNQFYLGNYQTVLELWKDLDRDVDPSSSDFASQQTQFVELLLFTHRAILHFLKSDDEKIKENQALLDKYRQSLDLYVAFFTKVDEGLGETSLEETLEELNQFPIPTESPWMTEFVSLSKKVIHNFLCFTNGKFDLFVSVDPKYGESLMDFRMLKFQAFSRNNQTKEARRMYQKMKAENDEHILVNFAQFEIENRFERNHEEALEILVEIKQKFGESPKLINMNIASLILKREFFKV